MSARGRAAIVGVGEAAILGAPPGSTSLDVAGAAAAAALDDAGLTMTDVDGLFTASSYFPMAGLDTGEYLGVRPRHVDSTNSGGSSFVSHVMHAAEALEAGRCDNALIVYGSTQRSGGGKHISPTKLSVYEEPFGPRYPVSMYALAAARHMAQYGTTREQLAAVAVAAREWANLNPAAYAHGPLTIDDVLGSRMVSTPLTVRDCCLVTDGGGAVVMTRKDVAGFTKQPPVFLLGGGEAQWHRGISEMPDLTETAAVQSGAAAFEQARLKPSDIDVVELYDAFTINPILFLEDLGFCPKGEGGAFVGDGAIGPKGLLPVNTNGGGLSYCHPGMYGIFLVIEAVRQLRGQGGDRQVSGARTALVHGNGGALSAQATAILGTGEVAG